MNSKVYKYCCVPMCRNTTIKTPQKIFVHVPNSDKIRKKWFQLARRQDAPKSKGVYFCEDHFDLPRDMENYMQYKIMGFGAVQQIRMIPNCIPSKFHCQSEIQQADNISISAQEMLDRPAEPVVVKQELVFQEDVPSLGSPGIQEVDASPLGLLLPVKFEPDTDDLMKQEVDIGPDVLYKPLSFPAPQLLDTVKHECTHSDGDAQEMLDRPAELVVVKQELELQEDVPTLGSPGTQQVGLLLPVKFEPDTDVFIQQEVDIGPDVIYKPVTFPAPQLLDTVKHESTHSDGDGTVSSVGDNNPEINSAQHLIIGKVTKLNVYENETSTKSVEKHKTENIYSCNICEYKTAYKGNLKAHMCIHTRTHTGEKPYSCSYCKYKCSLKGTLDKHVMRTHAEKKLYSCSYCQYKCPAKKDLIIHMRTHPGEKSYNCNDCIYTCSIKSLLVQHIRRHTGEKPYSCSYCQYKCSIRSSLFKHLRIHTGEKPYSCSYCQYKGSIKSHLVLHMRTHTGEKPYSCSYCQYKCSTKSNLVKHVHTHTGEKRYSCDICQYKCLAKHHLIIHMRTHTGEKPYSCNSCKYKCSMKSRLIQHMRSHTGEKLYSCSLCQYKCSIKSNLVRHMRIHTGEKPYNCDVCEYKCLVKGRLVSHMRTHTGEKPFSCSYCQYKYSSKGSLMRHIRTHI